jgi:predicted nuclease of predicted toxin-antitoxin system
VRFLIDECLPPALAAELRDAGHDCVHVYEIGLGGQPDEQVMALADHDQRILISADTDFGDAAALRLHAAAQDRPLRTMLRC